MNRTIRIKNFLLHHIGEFLKTITLLQGGSTVKWNGTAEPHDPLAKPREERLKHVKII